MHKSLKLALLALVFGAVAHAQGGALPSTEDELAADLGSAHWKPAPKPLPEGVSVSPIAVDPHTKGSIGYAKFTPGLDFPLHWHSYTEYTVLLSGKATFIVEGKPHEMAPGSYIVIPPKAKHELKCGAGAECVALTRRAGPTDYNWVK